jgi:hypothetical protein
LIIDSCITVALKCGQVSVFQLAHLIKVSVSEKAWLGMVKPPWKRLDGALMMPDVVRMFKAEKSGVNTEGKWVVLVFRGRIKTISVDIYICYEVLSINTSKIRPESYIQISFLLSILTGFDIPFFMRFSSCPISW